MQNGTIIPPKGGTNEGITGKNSHRIGGSSDTSVLLAGTARSATPIKLHCDFETRSAVDLRVAGLHNYAADPSTDVNCFAWAVEDEQPRLWFPGQDDRDLRHALKHSTLTYAHNAAFELQIWNQICVKRYGWPPLNPQFTRCTMAMAYAMALPGALEKVAPALGLDINKDAVGKRVMMKLAQPKADGLFYTTESNPDDFQKLYIYCKQDVLVERGIHARLMELSSQEQRVWELDYEINCRGVQVDLPAINQAIKLVEAETARLNTEMLKVTCGAVGKCTEVQLLVKWIRTQGVEIKGLAKADVLDSLDGELPESVRAALNLRREAAKSSTAKLVAMRERASADGRIRGIHQYHGASTGRWAGRGVQTQNLPRPRKGIKPKHIHDIVSHLANRDYVDAMYGPVMDAIADCVRGMIVAKQGCELSEVDFSAIEARVLAWLAGEQSVLGIFAADEDVYIYAAAMIFGCKPAEVTPEQRQIGKVAVLALGYGGGKGAFQSMARNYNVKVSDDEAETIKVNWRDAHPSIVKYWYDLENAAINALTQGGVHKAGAAHCEIAFKVNGSFLWCKLPSGRVLCYPYPEIREIETPWGTYKNALTFMTELDSTQRKKTKTLPDANAKGNWCRISTYGGSLAENVTQAVARDLLVNALFTLDANGFDLVMHIHDSTVVEIESSCDYHTLKGLEELVCELPEWAAGLPMKAEGWRARRFQK
jgi:DNA polymerase